MRFFFCIFFGFSNRLDEECAIWYLPAKNKPKDKIEEVGRFRSD